jgi:hypothetical protein
MKKKKMPLMMTNVEIIVPKKLIEKSEKKLQHIIEKAKFKNERKYFMIIFDDNHIYLLKSNKLEDAIKKAKKELLSGYGKMWKLIEIRSAGEIFTSNTSNKHIKVIRGIPPFVF